MTYKEVGGKEPCICFILDDQKKEGRKFLKWAKELGCVWLNGEEINPKKGVNFFHISMHSDGKLANVSMFAWIAPRFKDVKRVRFKEYIITL